MHLIPKDIHILISGSYKHVTLHGKREINLKFEIKVANQLSQNKEIVLGSLTLVQTHGLLKVEEEAEELFREM